MKNRTCLKRTLALALAAALLLTSCGGRAKATAMHLRKTEGRVSVSDDGGRDLEPRDDLGLYSGYGVDTRSESYAWIDLDEVKLTKLDEDSEIEIQKDGKDLEIEVLSGSLFFNVTEPLAGDETMTIRTSTMAVGIRGTCGWVALSEDEERFSVYLLEGKVRCEADGEKETVRAGEMAVMTEDGQITVEKFTAADVPAFVEEELDGLNADEIDDTLERLEEQAAADQGRKAALLAALDSLDEDAAMYAALGDLNGDGVEDLLIFGRNEYQQRTDFLFSGYIWDGSEAQYVLFDKTGFLGIGSEDFRVYRERDTGILYGSYFLYMDASYIRSFENAADVISMGIDLESEMDTPTEEEKQGLEDEINQRFELIDPLKFPVREVFDTGYETTDQYYWFSHWQYGGERPAAFPEFHTSVEAVRAQLAP